MSDPFGSTTWTYDLRGRMTQESKIITGSGTFVTQYDYYSSDQVKWMKYPANNTGGVGEQVTFTSRPQMLLNTAIGSTMYVKSTTYDAAGRVDRRALGSNGSNPILRTYYDYYPWTSQGGRLQYLTTGTPSAPTSLQDLAYTYDAVGNVITILDGRNSSQKQCFMYNNLNRLTKGTTYTDAPKGCTTQLGNGNYDESYS